MQSSDIIDCENSAECEALVQDLCQIEKNSVQLLSASQNLHIFSLLLSNFRNYEYVRLEVTPAPVVLTGANGTGKTNILEAISLLSAGRGLRRARLSEMDSISSSCRGEAGVGGVPWAIAANVFGKNGQVKIGTGRALDVTLPTSPLQGEENKRIVKIDGKVAKGQAELSHHVSLIWLTPQMEQLFSEGASAGRKFLDRLVFSFDGEHATRINAYDYAMRERNKLLQYGKADTSWLSTLEQKMAQCASAIAISRISTCEHINHTIAVSPLSFPKAYINVVGFTEDLLKNGSSSIEIENALQNAFAANRNQDAAAGRTLMGTHRSELSVIHKGKNMPAENCSMGEQKALLLSIILAQARSGARWHGVTPIILLDEVAGHLDATKRLELFEEIYDIGAQTWMTGTDLSLFKGLEEKAQFFSVENNAIVQN